MKDGTGIEGAFPPVGNSDYLNENPNCGISAVVHGLSGESNQEGDQPDNHTAHADMEMGADEPTAESIYNVSSKWKNRHGETLALDDLGGKVQVVAMVYTHCEHACPRILADMKHIRDNLSEELLSQTNFTIISIAPEWDTPQRLTDFANENKLSEDKWTLSNGDQGDVLEIAALLGGSTNASILFYPFQYDYRIK